MKTLKITATLLCFFAVNLLFSQSYVGPRVGATIADVENTVNGVEVDTRSSTNLQLGLALDLGITTAFSIQPELFYSGRTYKLELLGQEVRRTFSYIDLGALAKIRFGTENAVGAYIGAGPFLNYAISGKTEVGNDETEIEFGDNDIKRTDLSVAGALGLTFNIGGPLIVVDTRYVLGLGDIDSGDEREVRNRTIGVTAGIMVPL